MLRWTRLLLLLSVFAFAGAEAQAISMVVSPVSTASLIVRANKVHGYEFQVTQAISVTALGFWDSSQDGLGSTHDVGLWLLDQTPLGSVTVPSGTAGTLDGDFRYASLGAAVVLSPGNTYVIGGTSGAVDTLLANTPPVLQPIFTLVRQRSASSPPLFFPTGSTGCCTTVSLQYTPVPEPSGAALLAVAAGIACIRPRRRWSSAG